MNPLSMSFDEQRDVNYLQFDPKTVLTDLQKAIPALDLVGLVHSRKWCCEMLQCITIGTASTEGGGGDELDDGINLNITARELGTSSSLYLMAKSYFDLREYTRCANHLRNCTSGYGFFLRLYALYLDGLKHRCDDFVDVFPDTASNQRQATTKASLDNTWLIRLRTELTTNEKTQPLNGYSCYVYALVLKRLGLLNEALPYFVRTVKAVPHLWSAWEDLVTLIDSEQKLHSLDLPKHWIRNVFYARCYVELHKPELCVYICKELTQIGFHNSTYILLLQAKAYETGAELQLARTCCEDARTIDPYNLDSMDIFSNILFVLEDYHALAGLAQKCIEIEKYRFETCIVVGNFYSIRNDHARAIQYFTRALRMNPDYPAAWILLGHEFVEGKNHAAAINAYREALDLNRRDHRAWYGLGETYEIIKMYNYALYYFKEAFALKPNDSRYSNALGEVYERTQKLHEAKKCYWRSYCVGDIEGNALAKYAHVCDHLKDEETAARAYMEFIRTQELRQVKNFTEFSHAAEFLANYHVKKRQYDQACSYARKCLEFPEVKNAAKDILNKITGLREGQQQLKDKEFSQQQTSAPVPTAQSTIHEFDSSLTTTID
ncbi:unnamed protein product [Rotaria socialis]|uniref:Cdc23 domain-containing protein n=1 Tax=Rotaria socialis TaxID=392032 RepID=A0A820T7A1_9BILA|nr:unnamed protein product [Rotaria socialis]CAF3438772.1 unnamed protein product [Rotaria socialis]CAF3664539.1 unnamed protein product [Rotaria socialis]CAF4153632.1 unnamed protein product [Rotaria socialis]CAF4275849.1 unnamed protein product [Rotaria socialis]